jgi:CheY-like chemotaxis protein
MKALSASSMLVPSPYGIVYLLALGAAVVGEARILMARLRALRCAAVARSVGRVLGGIRGGNSLGGRRPTPDEQSRPRLDGIPIVVVEDDADAREMLAELLRSSGARVATAPTARMALLVLREVTPTVVVTDLAMPGESGVWLLQRLREHPRWRRIPVIAFTGRSHSFAAREGGFAALLRKPDDLDRLCAAVASVVARNAA